MSSSSIARPPSPVLLLITQQIHARNPTHTIQNHTDTACWSNISREIDDTLPRHGHMHGYKNRLTCLIRAHLYCLDSVSRALPPLVLYPAADSAYLAPDASPHPPWRSRRPIFTSMLDDDPASFLRLLARSSQYCFGSVLPPPPRALLPPVLHPRRRLLFASPPTLYLSTLATSPSVFTWMLLDDGARYTTRSPSSASSTTVADSCLLRPRRVTPSTRASSRSLVLTKSQPPHSLRLALRAPPAFAARPPPPSSVPRHDSRHKDHSALAVTASTWITCDGAHDKSAMSTEARDDHSTTLYPVNPAPRSQLDFQARLQIRVTFGSAGRDPPAFVALFPYLWLPFPAVFVSLSSFVLHHSSVSALFFASNCTSKFLHSSPNFPSITSLFLPSIDCNSPGDINIVGRRDGL
ncbi:hypothetical protein C8R46DRAFT_1228714 [Mycena filopes]|nr:hypothetical protein C8R46DRAFT_1228714 [Mycena filopes]